MPYRLSPGSKALQSVPALLQGRGGPAPEYSSKADSVDAYLFAFCYHLLVEAALGREVAEELDPVDQGASTSVVRLGEPCSLLCWCEGGQGSVEHWLVQPLLLDRRLLLCVVVKAESAQDSRKRPQVGTGPWGTQSPVHPKVCAQRSRQTRS